MAPVIDQDLFRTHSITNYINAAYQGGFTYQNILSRLGSPLFDSNELARIQATLKEVAPWIAALWKSHALFSASWKTAETFDSKRALELLGGTRAELVQAQAQIETILAKPDFKKNSDDVKFLIASYGRFTYSRDNYIRGFIEYGKVFKNDDMFKRFSEHALGAQDDINRTSNFVKLYLENPNQPENYFAHLRYNGSKLPPAFRSQVHDINMILSDFSEPLTHESLGIPIAMVEDFKKLGLGPEATGYWVAARCTPAETFSWGHVGVVDAQTATSWKILNFTPELAGPWIKETFPPEAAAAWHNAGFTPTEALRKIEKGFLKPSDLPKH